MTRTRVVSAAFAIAMATSASAQDPRSEDIKRWLGFYDTAFSAKDLTRLAGFYHPDVTIYEGGSVNTGWVDYRDHHLGPEVEEMQSPTLSHSDVTVHMLDKEGGAAYVTSEYRLKTRIKDRDIDAAGLETLIVVKGSEGAWKIRHSHTSSRRRPASPAPPPPGAGRD